MARYPSRRDLRFTGTRLFDWEIKENNLREETRFQRMSPEMHIEARVIPFLSFPLWLFQDGRQTALGYDHPPCGCGYCCGLRTFTAGRKLGRGCSSTKAQCPKGGSSCPCHSFLSSSCFFAHSAVYSRQTQKPKIAGRVFLFQPNWVLINSHPHPFQAEGNSISIIPGTVSGGTNSSTTPLLRMQIQKHSTHRGVEHSPAFQSLVAQPRDAEERDRCLSPWLEKLDFIKEQTCSTLYTILTSLMSRDQVEERFLRLQSMLTTISEDNPQTSLESQLVKCL